MNWWMIPLSVSVLATAMVACGGDDENPTSTPSGGGTNGGNAGSSNVAGTTTGGTGGNGPSVAGFARLGNGAGFVGEDPVVMVVGGVPALGYTVFDVGPRLHFFQSGAWGTSVSDPTSGPGVLNAYRQNGFCSDGTRVYLAHTQIGAGAGDLNNHLFAYQYQGGAWAPFGGGELSMGDTAALSPWEPGISCPAGADPTVTWVQAPPPSGSSAANVAGWVASLTSASAVRAGPLLSVANAQFATDVRVTSVATEPGGPSYAAAWEDDGQGREQLFVYRVDGANTTALGAALAVDQTADSPTHPQEPGIAVASGAPVVAWEASLTADGTRDIFVARWNGNGWDALGGPVRGFPDTHYTSRQPALAAADGALFLAWVESTSSQPMSLFIARWTDTEWSRIGEVLNVDPARAVEDPSIAVVDGLIYVAFEEFVDGARQIFVKMAN